MPYNFGTEVIQQIPVSDRTEGLKELDFSCEPVPIERALGVQWCIESDTFNFTLSLRDRPCTRRGILSTISSIYDLLDFVAPVLLEGKTILQELCRNNTGWDDPVPNDIQSEWFKWKSELEDLQSFAIPRCYKPINFGRVIRAEIHHFSDACFKGYGQCSYLKLVNENGKICYSFELGKAQVTPMKAVTISWLELTAVVPSAGVRKKLKGELDIEITDEDRQQSGPRLHR